MSKYEINIFHGRDLKLWADMAQLHDYANPHFEVSFGYLPADLVCLTGVVKKTRVVARLYLKCGGGYPKEVQLNEDGRLYIKKDEMQDLTSVSRNYYKGKDYETYEDNTFSNDAKGICELIHCVVMPMGVENDYIYMPAVNVRCHYCTIAWRRKNRFLAWLRKTMNMRVW